MKSVHLWHGAVGIALVCAGIAIVGGVAYLLYSPGLPSGVPVESDDTAVYTCGETTVVAIFSGDEATLTFSDGRAANVLYTPPSPGSEAEGSPWKRYASPDGFVFWRSSDVAFFEQNGATLYGECKANEG